MEGYHFLATNAEPLKDIIKREENIYIPKYLLFDEKGMLLDDSLPRSSSGKTMLKKIEGLIKD